MCTEIGYTHIHLSWNNDTGKELFPGIHRGPPLLAIYTKVKQSQEHSMATFLNHLDQNVGTVQTDENLTFEN